MHYRSNNNKIFDPYTDYSGRQFCHLKAIRPVNVSDSGKKLMYEFECQKCKKIITEWMDRVFHYKVRSCGCTKHNDLVGGVFMRLTVVERVGSKKHPNGSCEALYRCRCQCGNEVLVTGNALCTIHAKSCGCLRVDQATRPLPDWIDRETYNSLTHRLADIKQRCYNPNDTQYDTYGKKGVYVCDEWMEDSLNFCKWFMSQPNWKIDMEVDRENKGIYQEKQDGPYAPWNCRLAYRPTQLTNRTVSHFIDVDGHHLTGTQWSVFLGLPHRDSLYSYIQHHTYEETVELIRRKMKEMDVGNITDREILYRVYGEKALDGGTL